MDKYNIKQYFISSSLEYTLLNFKNKYSNINNSTLFIGFFTDNRLKFCNNELKLLENHKGDIYMLWISNLTVGSSFKVVNLNNASKVTALNIKQHFCLTQNMHLFLSKLDKINVIYYKNKYKQKYYKQKKYNINDQINHSNLDYFNKNIDRFTHLISKYANILFICSDSPGYGGAATNCYNLQKYYSKNHNTYGIYYCFMSDTRKISKHNDEYCVIKQSEFKKKISNLTFKPDLIIFKSPLVCDENLGLKHFFRNLRRLFNCPIYYCIGGIFKNNLDKYYFELQHNEDYEKYYNMSVINQIKIVDKAFSNSELTQKILKDVYNIKTDIFYSGVVPFYKKKIKQNVNFNDRKYEYALIVSNFNRTIKNIKKTINFLKDKNNVILIGLNSSIYKKYGFECIDLIDHDKLVWYYKQIKYVVQDSFFESYSNVKIEAAFQGCKIISSSVVDNKPIYED